MRRQDQWAAKFIDEGLPKLLMAVRPSRVIISGSRVRGEVGEASDLDVIVVADSFRDIPFLKRMPLLLKLVRFEKHIDFLCYTEEEFEQVKETSSIVKSALEEGTVVVNSHVVGGREGEDDGD